MYNLGMILSQRYSPAQPMWMAENAKPKRRPAEDVTTGKEWECYVAAMEGITFLGKCAVICEYAMHFIYFRALHCALHIY